LSRPAPRRMVARQREPRVSVAAAYSTTAPGT
jgi:hypothetical protein